MHLETVARIWRGGCIIRAALLEDIRTAYIKNPELANLLVDDHFSRELMNRQADWRAVVQQAVAWGLPAPGLAVSLAYYDAYRRERLPANLIQAQRDFSAPTPMSALTPPARFTPPGRVPDDG